MAKRTSRKSAKIGQSLPAVAVGDVAAKAAKPGKAVAESSSHFGDEFSDAVDRFVSEAEAFAQCATTHVFSQAMRWSCAQGESTQLRG